MNQISFCFRSYCIKILALVLFVFLQSCHKDLRVSSDQKKTISSGKRTFIFDFDDTVYDTSKSGIYLKMALKLFVLGKKNKRDLIVGKVKEAETGNIGLLMQKLIKNGDQVIILGGWAGGCAIIPDIVAGYGVEQNNVYSGYFNKDDKKNLLKMIFYKHRYVNCANPGLPTPYTDLKSKFITFLKKSEQITGDEVILIGDGLNDLEALYSGTIDKFIGFGVNRKVEKVRKDATVFVDSVDKLAKECLP